MLAQDLDQMRSGHTDALSAGLMSQPNLELAAANRSCTEQQLIRLLSSDLNAITQKALEPDRNDRYQTAKQLADDLTNFLECRPLIANQRNVRRSLGSCWKRHRKQLTLLLVGLMVGCLLGATLLLLPFTRSDAITFSLINLSTLEDTPCVISLPDRRSSHDPSAIRVNGRQLNPGNVIAVTGGVVRLNDQGELIAIPWRIAMRKWNSR